MADVLKRREVRTEEEYRSEENEQFPRHEFINGYVDARVGASEGHSDIKIDRVVWLRPRLPEGCRVFDGDTKLRMKSKAETRIYYPDLFVSFGPRDRTQFVRDDALWGMEILSSTTERGDRREKLDGYIRVPSLHEYLLIHQNSSAVEVSRRRTGWTAERYGLHDTIPLDAIGEALPVAVVYHDLAD